MEELEEVKTLWKAILELGKVHGLNCGEKIYYFLQRGVIPFAEISAKINKFLLILLLLLAISVSYKYNI